MGSVNPVYPKVLLVIYDFMGGSSGDLSLRQRLGWSDPSNLAEQFIQDLQLASNSYCNYEIVESLVLNGYPVKEDGFRYAREEYSSAWRSRTGFHQPDWADYGQIVSSLNLSELVHLRKIDEVWLFAGPYAGFYESRMVGPGAFWCNSPPIEGYESISRRYVIMGFNYERGVGEMLESYGHRAESVMNQVYRKKRGSSNLWERFTRHEKTHPGQAEVGTIHFAPNSLRDYDWGNKSSVSSRCDSWLAYPDLSGQPRLVNCDDWGGGDTRRHHVWWLKRLPRAAGVTGGIADNWWEYIVDPNRAD